MKKRNKAIPKKKVSLDKVASFVSKPLDRFSSETDYLMQPYAPEIEPVDWDLINAVSECVEMLGEKEKELIYGIFHDGKTYEELTKVAKVKAKSHAWKNTQNALGHLKTIMEQNPKIRDYIKEKK